MKIKISPDKENNTNPRTCRFIFIPAILVLWMVLWMVISATPSLMGYLSGQMDFRTAVIICARASMVGLISSFVASHLMETYSRRKLIPFFFPQGRLVNVGGTFRISISRRIQLLNRLGNIVPGIILLVTLLTLQWEVDASQISSIEYGWIIIRFSLILFGIFFIMTHVLNSVGSRNVTEPIKEMIRAGEMFGKEAICRLIRENADAEANALLDVIIDALDRFRDGFSLQDDVTLIVVKIGKA